MTKKMYEQLIHTAKRPETLDEIIFTAMDDIEIGGDDFVELLREKHEFIMKKWGL